MHIGFRHDFRGTANEGAGIALVGTHIIGLGGGDVAGVAAQKHGIGDLNKVHGPLLREVNYTDISKAELKFDYVDEGLTTLDGTGYVKGIEVQIEYNGQLIWLPHEGEVIVGKDTIMIDTGEFPLFGVRYNRQLTAKFPETLNLCNSYKMPAIAFVNYRMP